MKFVKIALIIALTIIFVVACSQTQDNKNSVQNINKKTDEKSEVTTAVDELSKGRKVYKEQCVRCHREDGTGGEVDIMGKKLNADDLTSDKMKNMPDEKYIKYIKDGIPDEGMPAFKDILSEEEVKEVIKFIRKEIQK